MVAWVVDVMGASGDGWGGGSLVVLCGASSAPSPRAVCATQCRRGVIVGVQRRREGGGGWAQHAPGATTTLCPLSCAMAIAAFVG